MAKAGPLTGQDLTQLQRITDQKLRSILDALRTSTFRPLIGSRRGRAHFARGVGIRSRSTTCAPKCAGPSASWNQLLEPTDQQMLRALRKW